VPKPAAKIIAVLTIKFSRKDAKKRKDAFNIVAPLQTWRLCVKFNLR